MFTGIIESLGTVVAVTPEAGNVDISIRSGITHELKIDQSVAHNGVCLTVVSISGDVYRVTAISETLSRSNLGDLKTGDIVNLERSMVVNGRLDGHLVQGHVDVTGVCASVEDSAGSWIFRFTYPSRYDGLVVEKGSICINGVSLTVAGTGTGWLSVAIIPYTFENTNFSRIKSGSVVNLEFDILGKYVLKSLGKL
jgi:riboflavin synthase